MTSAYSCPQPPVDELRLRYVPRAESEAYFAWFTAQVVPRSECLWEFMDRRHRHYSSLRFGGLDSLHALWNDVASSLVWLPGRSGKLDKLDEGSRCRVRDLGLYVGLAVRGACSNAHWILCEDPGSLEYQSPVLSGFASPFNTVSVTKNLVGRIFLGTSDPALLTRTVSYWLEQQRG